jgi:hypothetical protein
MLLGTFILKIISLILACTFTYQSYAAFRFAYTETQSTASAPPENPKGTSTRLVRIVWGLASLAISLGFFSI